MKQFLTKSVFLCLIGIFTCYGLVLGQEDYRDHRKWYPEGTVFADDPLHRPVNSWALGFTGGSYDAGTPEGSLVLTGGRIFDGTGSAVRNGTIVIEQNVITDILSPGSTNWPRDARVIDVAGKTIMPGLIAMHETITKAKGNIPDGPSLATHAPAITINAAERLKWYVESGITSIRDVESHGDIPFRLGDFVRMNRIPGPRMFNAGQLITSTGGHSIEGIWMNDRLVDAVYATDGPDEWMKSVRVQFTNGAVFISVASGFSRDEITALTREAHALGMKVSANAETFYIQRAVEAGVDVIEHLLPRSDRTIRMMALEGTQAIPTITSAMRKIDRDGGYFGEASRRFTVTKESIMETFQQMRDAGITMGIGLDMGNAASELPSTYIQELKYFVEGGYSITEALIAATKTNAEILDMDDRLGTIEQGKLADITVIDGRPDVDLDDLANVDLVIRDGHIIIEDGRVNITPHDPKAVMPEGHWSTR